MPTEVFNTVLLALALLLVVGLGVFSLYALAIWYRVHRQPVGEDVFVCNVHGPMFKKDCMTFRQIFEFDPDPNWVKEEGTEAFYYCPLCYGHTLRWALKNPLPGK